MNINIALYKTRHEIILAHLLDMNYKPIEEDDDLPMYLRTYPEVMTYLAKLPSKNRQKQSEAIGMLNGLAEGMLDVIKKNVDNLMRGFVAPLCKLSIDTDSTVGFDMSVLEYMDLAGITKKEWDKFEYNMYCYGISAKKIFESKIMLERGVDEGGSYNMLNVDTISNAMIDPNYAFIQLTNFAIDTYDEGNHIFRIEEQLHNELLLTDISRIDSSFLRLPYEVMYIDIPHNSLLKYKTYTVKGIYLAGWNDGENCNLEILVVTNDGSQYHDTFSLIGTSEYNFGPGDIFEQMKKQVGDKWYSKTVTDENEVLMSYVVSLLLYMNSNSNDGVIISPKFDKVRLSSNITRYPTCSLGSKITINRELYQRVGDDTDETKEYNRHILKWSVRGHFRNQAKGEGRKDRELIWIRPHLKGNERNSDINPKPSSYIVK